MATDATSSTTSTSSSSTLSDLTSTLLSGSINFTGLGSGTDFTEIIDQLVEIESINKTRLETWKATWEDKITDMEALQTRMLALQEAAADMDTAEEFNVKGVSSSDTSVVNASVTNEAANGAYQITVGTDVKHIMRSTGCADANSTAYGGAGGTLKFSMNGTTYSVAVAAGATLNTIASSINTAVGSTVATVVNDGTSSNPYHLQLTSTTGGSDGRITILQNPTDLGLTTQGIDLQSYDTWTGTSSVNILGQFSGDKTVSSNDTYVFTVNASTSPATIGTDAFTISWTNTARGTSGTLTVDADYTAGDALEMDNGFSISLEDGTVTNGDQFTLRAFANDIDDAEMGTWNGTSAVTTGGNYLGTVNKTYSFTVMSDGTVNAGGTAGTTVLRWVDSTGATGTVSVSDSTQTYELEEGITLQLSAGTLENGDNFQINVFAPDLQQGQDKGLAQAAKVVHDGFADEDLTPVTSTDGTFSFTYGGTTTSIDVPAGYTLSQLVTIINEDANNPGVTASVINDGLGLPTSYRLVLTGQDTGAQYQITNVSHTLDALGNGGSLGGGFTTSQLATNAMVKIDGYPAETDIYLQRDSNTIADVITGVTLSLADAGEAVITVSTDTQSIYGKIEALVNAVNYVQAYIRESTSYDADEDEAGILIGNYSYYIIKSRVDSTLNTRIGGLVDGTDTYINLAQIGIHTDPDDEGNWVIDDTTLLAALASDPDAVANLFIENTETGTEGAAKRVYDEMEALTDSEDGPLNVLMNNYTTIIENIDTKIEREEDRLELYRTRLTERFSRMETTLSELNAEASAIESAIAQLPSSSS